MESSQIGSANWSRASKGYELKIFTRDNEVVQLDGFDQEVCSDETVTYFANNCRISIGLPKHSESGMGFL